MSGPVFRSHRCRCTFVRESIRKEAVVIDGEDGKDPLHEGVRIVCFLPSQPEKASDCCAEPAELRTQGQRLGLWLLGEFI